MDESEAQQNPTGRKRSFNDLDQGRFPATAQPFVQLAQYSTDLIALCDLDGKLVYLNPAGRALIGVDGSDIFPRRLTDYVVPSQQHLVDELVVPAAREKGAWQGAMQLVHMRTGAAIDVARSTFALVDDKNRATGFASVMRDVTAEQTEKDRLKREAETFYALIENDPFGVYIIDADFKVRQISQGAQRVFATVQPVIGRDLGRRPESNMGGAVRDRSHRSLSSHLGNG